MGASVRNASSSYVADGATSGAVVIPTDTVVGDLLLLCVGSSGTANIGVSGWGSQAAGSRTRVFARWAVAGDAGASQTVTGLTGANSLLIVSHMGATGLAPAASVDQSSSSSLATSPVAASAGELAVEFGCTRTLSGTASLTSYPPGTVRSYDNQLVSVAYCRQVQGSTGQTPSFVFSGNGVDVEAITLVLAGNSPPNAPAVSVPSTFDRAVVNRINVPLSDPDPGDSQSKLDVQWWDSAALGGARVGAVHTYTQANPNQFWDSPGNTFTAGPKELQARSYDALGKVGPYSASVFFTAGTAPDGLVITQPLNGAAVAQNVLLKWSTPTQDAYQVQVLDGATVVSDTGEVVDTGARQYALTFPTNNVGRTIQARRKFGGLWQAAWTAVTVTVSFTRPATPLVTLMPDPARGAMVVGISNPAPGAGVPAASYNNVFVTDPGKSEERRAYQLATNQPWTYWLAPSKFDGVVGGSLRVETVGANGTSAFGVPTADAAPVTPPPVNPPPSGAGTYPAATVYPATTLYPAGA